MKKILIITPHLSTGGLPQFLLKKIEILIKEFEIYLVEWDNITGGELVVQRNKISEILKNNLITLHDDKNSILNLIKYIRPDIIHFEEFPETFIGYSILDQIFLNLKDELGYLITETTHGTLFNKDDKKYFADKTMFVSKINYSQYYDITNSNEVIEFEVNKDISRVEKLTELGLDPEYIHIMNVGLFNRNKNQSEVFEYAKLLSNEKVKFHFFGNMAGNFVDYWKPLINNKPDNCVIWDERNDLHKFYSCMDLFLFTSKLENRPLSVIEALSNNMKILMYNLPNYGGEFSKYENVSYLTNSLEQNVDIIKSIFNLNKETKNNKVVEEVQTNLTGLEKLERKISSYHILTDIDTDREVSSMISLTQLKRYGLSYKSCINKRYTELPPVETCEYPEKVSMDPGGKLTPGHYGCYLAHKGAFYEGINSDSDYILIFECDCVIDVTYDEFMNKVNLSCDILDKTDLLMFSFGYHNGVHILEQNPEYWVVNKFYGAHAYLIPKKSFGIIKDMYENNKWNVTDLLFVEKLDQYKTGIFEVPLTKQAAGYSILDKIYNEDRH
jgi:glycosyltransferase involved in cell wall biosynthesis